MLPLCADAKIAPRYKMGDPHNKNIESNNLSGRKVVSSDFFSKENPYELGYIGLDFHNSTTKRSVRMCFVRWHP